MSNLQSLVEKIKQVAQSVPSINTVSTENVYDAMNGNRQVKYASFIISQGTHRYLENQTWYNFNLIYIDRLVDNLESNKIEVQSTAIEVLKNIIKEVCGEEDIDRTEVALDTFTERWNDLTAGAFANVSFVVMDDDCYETYD